MSENKFVFVVCGAREHIDTLHFSLRAIKRFSRNEAIVVTDSSRNEIQVSWDKVWDIKTPEHFNHHQASIYLKTGLHKFLPEGNCYCYLDTDVVALDNRVDEIFTLFVPPITFCSDHCKLESFSPYAVNCSCVKEFELKQPSPEILEKGKKLKALLDTYEPPLIRRRKQNLMRLIEKYFKNQFNSDGLNEEEAKELKTIRDEWKEKYEIKDAAAQQRVFDLVSLFRNLKKKPLFFPLYAWKIMTRYRKSFIDGGWYDYKGNFVLHKNTDISHYLLKFPGYHLDKESRKVRNKNGNWVYDLDYDFYTFFSKYPEFKWVEEDRKWYDHEGNVLIDATYTFLQLFAKQGFFFNLEEQLWYDEKGNLLMAYPLTSISCTHLHELAMTKFNVEIKKTNWQHWNGGVFLFNDSSYEFLDFWHNATLKIFEDKQWKTRDQGTLAMSAWKFGLQDHPLLWLEFNFIADYHHPTMFYKGNFIFDVNEKKENIKPHFIHIYHHWGDTNWDVWNDVDTFINKELA